MRIYAYLSMDLVTLFSLIKVISMSINIELAKQAFKTMRLLSVPESKRHISLIMHPFTPYSYTSSRVARRKMPYVVFTETLRNLGKRYRRVPIQYILGQWPFRRLNVRTLPPVFIPRPETAHMIDILKDIMGIGDGQYKSFVDLCCGSGVIGLSLAKECGMSGTMVDLNIKAIQATRINKERNGIKQDINLVHQSIESFIENSKEKFDVVVSNPPYIRDDVVKQLDREVRCYQSHLALKGGSDGLDLVRLILNNYQKILNPGGILMVEYGGELLEGDLARFQSCVLSDQFEARRFILISKGSI